jgi:hypothetical protein
MIALPLLCTVSNCGLGNEVGLSEVFDVKPPGGIKPLWRLFLSNIAEKERRLTMKKSICILGSTLFFLFFYGVLVQAQTGNEIIEPVTSTWYLTSKPLPLDKDISFTTWEAFGVVISDTGTGLFHEATVRCMGSFFVDKGVFKDDIGYGVYVLKNGDKAFFKTTFLRKPGTPTKATTTLIGGTGKCSGIQGSYDLIAYPLKPAMEGISQSYNKLNIKYKLP